VKLSEELKTNVPITKESKFIMNASKSNISTQNEATEDKTVSNNTVVTNNTNMQKGL
jgi:hypothetical protein